MGTLNIYKIDNDKLQDLMQTLNQKMQQMGTQTIPEPIGETRENQPIRCELYYAQQENPVSLSWDWVLAAFGQESVRTNPLPKAVLLLKKENGAIYAITFGHAFFLIDKFCDRDFGFVFARKMNFQEITTTTLTAPNSHRNKMVNTYVNYEELDFDSGESYAKLKAKAALPDEFTLFKPMVEIGTSIRVDSAENSLERAAAIIAYIENIVDTEADKHKIPVFTHIKDQERKRFLNERLNLFVEMRHEIHVSELEVIGATEVFNHNDYEFVLKYRRYKEKVTSLSDDVLRSFCEANHIPLTEALNIAVYSERDGMVFAPVCVRDMIDYTDDQERCLLSQGQWYQYNDDYLSYLQASISEITTYYEPQYDFSEEKYNAFIETKLLAERTELRYSGKSDKEIREQLQKKYYAERVFNLLMERDYGFENHDRGTVPVGNGTVEIMDLYKEETMFAVKIGSTSGKLCYAVDQSLEALKLYKHNQLDNRPVIKSVAIWFVLDRSRHIENEDGKPDINRLDMLILKNRLDQWKKEVRLQGYTPIVYVNYRTR